MKISFIATVYNEEKTIEKFVESILKQSINPNEIIITDGGSTDKTLSIISNLKIPHSQKKKIQVLVKKGNRSVGRNEAIHHATGDIIVCTDSGNIVDKDWVKNITKPFGDKTVDVVAGYYKGIARTLFQKCIIPYALVMPDQVDSEDFLPATRSMAFTKAIWEKVGGFPEKFSHNEDYVFARTLRSSGAKIVFAKNALVYWIPRSNLKQAWYMMYRFALGDAEARIIRPRVIVLFARYIIGLFLFLVFLVTMNITVFAMIVILVISYFIWAIKKHYRYVRDPRSVFILPLLQLTADSAVITGTCFGFLKK